MKLQFISSLVLVGS